MSWGEWEGLSLPRSIIPYLDVNQDKKLNGWVWLGPPGCGKTTLASLWTNKMMEWAGLNPQKNLWYVNLASILSWDTWLNHLEQFVNQKRTPPTRGKYSCWIWFDVCERILPNQQWDLIDKLRDINAKHVGILWTVSSLYSWIPELTTGCQIWSWYDIMTRELWYEKYDVNTKPWNYFSLNDLRPERLDHHFVSLNTICKEAWICLVNHDLRGWVKKGGDMNLFRIPWVDLVETVRSVIIDTGIHDRLRQWYHEGIKLEVLFPRIGCIWHQWNQWGMIGIRIFSNLKRQITLPSMNVEDQIDPRVWLNELWSQETIKMNHLILWGPPGGGKTSFIEQWIHRWFGNPPDKRWVYYRNSSLDKWTKLFRNELEPFLASDPNKWGENPHKIQWRWVVLDEVDQMNTEAQDFLRSQIAMIQKEKLPVFFLLIANERAKLNWALTAKFQMIHWTTPSPQWISNIFPIQEDEPKVKIPNHSMYHWWLGAKSNLMREIPVPKRWWREESGDLRRYKIRHEMGALKEVKISKPFWLSRGDLQELFWEMWLEKEMVIPENDIWEKIPLWIPFHEKNQYMSFILGENVELPPLRYTQYALEVYYGWILRSYEKGILPPNATWVYPSGIPGIRWIAHIWKQVKEIYKDWHFELMVIDIEQTSRDANFIRDVLKTKTKLTSGGHQRANAWVLLNANLLEEEAQVSLRRLIDDTKNKIIWWFGVNHLRDWMSPLRSRAEPLLITPNGKLKTQHGTRWAVDEK